MTLHEAIAEVLAGGKQMSCGQIAEQVNRLGLYSRGDGRPVPPSQISARVHNYSHLFVLEDGLIRLGQPLAGGHLPAQVDAPAIAQTPTAIVVGHQPHFQDLGTVGDLIEQGIPRHAWLENCGIYQLKTPTVYVPRFHAPAEVIAAGNVIAPWQVDKLHAKWVANTDIVYIGLAGRHSPRSLRKRLTDLIKHAAGKTSDRGPHSGGEIIWQLVGWRDIHVWAVPTPDPPTPRDIEAAMIQDFHRQHGRLPFANRQQ